MRSHDYARSVVAFGHGPLLRFRTIICLVACFLSVTFSRDAMSQDSFSIEQILRAPHPSGLTPSPSGQKVAWVYNAEGVRNIWVAEAPDYNGRQLTTYAEDDGQTIGSLSFTPDEEHLVYRRGDGPNGRGETPNPLNRTDGTIQAIYVVALNGGEPLKLADGSSPTPGPGGNHVAYLKSGQAWIVAVDGSAEPESLFSIRGRAGSLRWSGNLDHPLLAFVSSRGDHSYVGIYGADEGAVRYLSPSVDNDSNPVWSPDGRRLAFVRRPSEGQELPFMPRRDALPWSIYVSDVESGEVRELWQAPEGMGSRFRSVSADNQLLWGAGDRIVFPWERQGWTHIYSISADGGDPVLLTPGEFEVQFVSLSQDRTEVLFSSNQDDIDRQHVWRAPVEGGRLRQATFGPGIQWAPVGTAKGGIAVLASTALEPAHPARVGRGASLHEMAPEARPADFPSGQLVEPEQVVFSAADGMQIHGQLFLPSVPDEGVQRPAVLYFHGGSRRQMLLGFHHSRYYHNAYAFNQYLASRGYIVLSVNYRSGIGYGMEFREAQNYGARGASEYNDVIGAALYLQSRADVDPDRIGLWGGSYGGYLTALGLARASELFAAGVDLHGVHDWNVVIRNFAPEYDPDARAAAARLAFESSPMADIETWRSPVLLIHGDDDRNVPFSETVTLVEALRRQGVYFEQIVFPDEVHGFLLHSNWLKAFWSSADFFERFLKRP